MNDTPQCIEISPDKLPELSPLFQKGICMKVIAGCTVRELLCEQFGLDIKTVKERISTLMIDGKPVDNIDEARIRNGITLALSSAMPGLVGAVMRRDGSLSSLRSGITYHETEKDSEMQTGVITVKLFNLLIREIGPAFLRYGFCVNAGDLKQLISYELPLSDAAALVMLQQK